MKQAAYIAFALLGLIWGTNFIFMKWAAAWISPTQIVFLRVLFGFLPILIFALLRRSLSWSHWRHSHHFLVMALLATVIYYYAFAKGTSLLLSSVAGMLSGAIPLFSFVTAWLFLRAEPLNSRTAFGIFLGFVGVILIARPWNSLAAGVDVSGVLYMIAGSLSVGCSFVYARRFITPLGLSPLALSTYQIGLALLLITLITDMHGMARISADPVALVGVILGLGLGLAGTGIAYILYYFIVQRLGALAASGVTYIPPVIALLIGTLLVGEPIKSLDLLAMLLILGGVYVLQSGKKNPTPGPTIATKPSH
ncbi:DMT family transporter [Pseudomonas sp. LB3P14]